ncbi:MAG: hypothetical protein M3O89_07205 [Actinomycetota bacterium]|nr:hypothetical protein [Actinomycetota bacterium]
MSDSVFEIEIITQGWTGSTEEDAERVDLCSHGDIRLTIGDCLIAPGDGEGDYTISTSALALLRTLESDHSPERPVAGSLVAFAEKAKRLFEGLDKVFHDDSDRQEYDEFWREYDERLSLTLG